MRQTDTKQLTEQYKGLRPARVMQLWGQAVRVVKADGENLPRTAEFRPNRLNVEVVKGKVVNVESIG